MEFSCDVHGCSSAAETCSIAGAPSSSISIASRLNGWIQHFLKPEIESLGVKDKAEEIIQSGHTWKTQLMLTITNAVYALMNM